MQLVNKKIAAFTLSEMLVVLVISGIVISLSLLVLNLVQQQVRSISRFQEVQSETQLLQRALWQDFNRHDINFSRQQLVCISEVDTVIYKFDKNYILRNSDTLKIPVSKVQLYLDGNLVTDTNLDALELQLSLDQIDKNIFVFKDKDAAYFMNDDF